MIINRIEAVTYGVDDIAAGIRYFTDWGLEIVESGAAGATFRTAENQLIDLRPRRNGGLPSAPDGDRSTAREVVWGVEDTASLLAIAAELAKDRDIREDSAGTLHSHDENGFGIGFRVEDRQLSSAEPSAVNFNERVQRLNRDVVAPAKASPIRLGHVVYNSAKGLGDAPSDFYLNRLGFRLSDRTLDGGDFMRCAGSKDHHTLFLTRRQETASFNHIAFEVRDFDEIMVGGTHMKAQGWAQETVAGRHILGSNMYWYFRNPCGGNTEYFADMDRMDDAWEPRIWEKNPGFSLWTVEGKADLPANPQAASLPGSD
jgi:catechol 2,3-dioxygenase-like lactoylglutathione lyase family enzyme